jgi:hypothetical protein
MAEAALKPNQNKRVPTLREAFEQVNHLPATDTRKLAVWNAIRLLPNLLRMP